ncbi:MAG: AarF/ABC1/UbiB kinase family protein [Pseudanabaena sp. RU_4_16]|nr:AarF/ABC1/UbiB kinase family protein [Pseudanabaena sp. RU_4_16]
MPAAKNSALQLDRYDAEAIAIHYQRQPLRVWWRFFSIFIPLFMLYLGMWWDRKTGRSLKMAKKKAIAIRQLLTKLGPAFIKIGQALSTRPDIVPPIYMDELAQLQDQLPAFPNATAFQLICEELGADPSEIYAEISANPIAAASLGQVYKGKLPTGEKVAIKVQRPDIAEGIALDMYILRGLSAWAKQNFRFIRSNLVAILDQFASRIFEEMDYTLEGKNAEKFAQYYGQQVEIYVPQIYWQFTAKRVLTMEWIEGVKLTELEKIKAKGFDSRQIIGVGVECSLRQLLDRGFFHADPHPGNLLVMNDGKLAYLDFGMMSYVEPEQRYGLIESIVHLVNRDFGALAKDYVRLGFLDASVDLEAIAPALAGVFNEALGAGVAELNFKNITDQLSQIMYDYPFEVPAYYAMIIRSLVTLEGIALGVDPNFKVLSLAYPYVANRILTDRTPELRDALKDLLFSEGSFRWTRLENLLRNAKSNQEYDLRETIDQVTDFLLSDRGEYMRDRLVDELVKGIETVAVQRLPKSFNSKANTKKSVASQLADDSSLEHLTTIWTILQQDRQIQPLEIVPIAGRILMKPETQAMGRHVMSQLAQRALARLIREMVLHNSDQVNNAGNSGDSPKAQPITVVTLSTSTSPVSRQVNGRSW